MLTHRQHLIAKQISAGHSLDVHFSPRQIAARLQVLGDHAVRLEIGRMIIDGEILAVEESRGARPARYKLRSCSCVFCKLD